jgi:protoporphyrin/coproporphyrin ferrochelatase
MPRFLGDPSYAHGTPACVGVLVTNLGTPDAPTPRALRRYLAEFLADPRVVETPRLIWWLALHGVILRVRPRRSARLYEKVWREAGSPLLRISRSQAAALQEALTQKFPGPVRVALGMRYGQPSVATALEELRRASVRRLLVLPLYPQYSATTTASTFDAVADQLKSWRWLPEIRFITHYHDEPGYIRALSRSIGESWEAQGRSQRLLFSFHGIPKRYFLDGDPYHCQCQKTARLVAEELGLRDGEWTVSFQSRFGPQEWLTPYTDHTLRDWAKDGAGSVDVVCPGFSADCLETLEEIAQLNREVFLSAGGQRYTYIPALNDGVEHIQFLAGLVARHGQGWPEASLDWDARRVSAELAQSRQRAAAMGAPR